MVTAPCLLLKIFSLTEFHSLKNPCNCETKSIRDSGWVVRVQGALDPDTPAGTLLDRVAERVSAAKAFAYHTAKVGQNFVSPVADEFFDFNPSTYPPDFRRFCGSEF